MKRTAPHFECFFVQIVGVNKSLFTILVKQDLLFLCSTGYPLVLYICVNFHKYTLNVFKLLSEREYLRETTICSVQRAITPKVGKPELWF